MSATREINREPIFTKFSRSYHDHAFVDGLRNQTPISAEMGEGFSEVSGGYAVPSIVSKEIVPLGLADTPIEELATTLPTTSDIRSAQGLTRGAVSIKTEGSDLSPTSATFAQFTLSAFLVGQRTPASWEWLQDVPTATAFIFQDASRALRELKDGYYVSGSGVGQPQGLLGNVGAGITEEPDGSGNAVTISGTLDLLATLKETYHQNATFLMRRSTSLILRKAALASGGAYAGVFTRENGLDYLHGYPVAYSSSMPAAARGNTPILLGDFKAGYIVGLRGGTGVFAKILDQNASEASQGLASVMSYQRVDGRVRLPEAIQGYTVAAS
jgi:HK97 family phage major capsid protein